MRVIAIGGIGGMGRIALEGYRTFLCRCRVQKSLDKFVGNIDGPRMPIDKFVKISSSRDE